MRESDDGTEVRPPSETEAGAPPQKEIRLDPDKLKMFQRKVRSEQNLPAGAAAGLIAALVGAALWAVVTVGTGYQIGFMAIGVGILVGFAVRLAGKGMDKSFGLLGAAMALLGCVLGNVLTIAAFVSQEHSVPVLEVLGAMGVSGSVEGLFATSNFMDAIFYAIAVYEGYKFSFRRISAEEVERLIA